MEARTAIDRPALILAMATAMWGERNDEDFAQVNDPWRTAFLQMAEAALEVVEATAADRG